MIISKNIKAPYEYIDAFNERLTWTGGSYEITSAGTPLSFFPATRKHFKKRCFPCQKGRNSLSPITKNNRASLGLRDLELSV